jgi:hypothetical protein
MKKIEKEKESFAESGDWQIVEGELLEVSSGGEIQQLGDEEETIIPHRPKKEKLKVELHRPKTKNQKPKTKNQIQYIFLPLIFLTVTFLGGLRFRMTDNAFLFLKPALICLIFAAGVLFLFFRARLVRLEGWFAEDFSMLKNIANGGVLLTLFTASAQIFNSLIPEQGLPFWIIAFCFFWTLWMNIFADFDTKKLLKSLGALFGIAFITKYLILAYLTAPVSESFWRGILQNPTQEFFTWLFDLPRFSAATGYFQFFAVILYLIGLFLMPVASVREED